MLSTLKQIGFKGTAHPARKVIFDKLAQHGVDIVVLQNGSYNEYLTDLSKMQFFMHADDDKWVLDGKQIEKNSLWGQRNRDRWPWMYCAAQDGR